MDIDSEIHSEMHTELEIERYSDTEIYRHIFEHKLRDTEGLAPDLCSKVNDSKIS